MDISTTESPVSTSANKTCELHRDERLAQVEISVLGCMFATAVLSNNLVLFAVWRSTRRKGLSRMELLIVHLSLADICVAVFNIFPTFVEKITQDFRAAALICPLKAYGSVLVLYASSYVLLATAFDRYLAVCRPIFSLSWTKRRTQTMVAVAWLASALFASPQLVFWKREQLTARKCYVCYPDFGGALPQRVYITFGTLSIFIIPALILTITYGRICVEVWRATSQATSANNFLRRNTSAESPHATNGLLKHRRSPNPSLTPSTLTTFKLTATVVVCFILCNTPYFFVVLWRTWDTNFPEDTGKTSHHSNLAENKRTAKRI